MKAKGLTLVFTGDGKGKSTAAFGAALRTLGHGGRVGVVQFFKYPVKSKAPNREGAFRATRKFGDKFRVWSFGGGFTWKVSRNVNQKAVNQAWKKCKVLLRDSKYSLLVFDEINIALKYKFLKTSEVIKALKKKSPRKQVILTGRGAPRELIKIADLVTEMKCIKHPFRTERPMKTNRKFSAALASNRVINESQCRKGILAQPGLDF